MSVKRNCFDEQSDIFRHVTGPRDALGSRPGIDRKRVLKRVSQHI
jgi:hypothetical protein